MMTIDRRRLLGGAAALAATSGGVSAQPAQSATRKPNFIVILCDDLGYGDVQPFGGRVPTPEIARMAAEGLRCTDYYAPANICTPSRAGILTGRYPVRTGLGYEVILAGDDRGLPLSEVTIANALKSSYKTALVGKWHLGQVAPYWPPTGHGFDYFFGIPYSHDIEPLDLYEAMAGHISKVPFDHHTLQQQFAQSAERFIVKNRDRPFFLELALSSPHLPAYPYKPFDGRTDQGPFGDTIAEIDQIVGRVLGKVRELGLAEDTLVIFTSDNGPWFEGSTGGLRDRKGGAGYDGCYRVPFIAWQPGHVPAGATTNAIMCGIDLLPTFCALAGVRLPERVEIDGKDLSKLLSSGRGPSPHEEILLFNNEEVVGVRTQEWKLVED
ncbi:MAG: sulfatase, partial [Oxalobacteraceae bacterium]